MRIMRNQRGFSLVEMIVAMVILGIAVAVAVPGMGALRAEYQLVGSANQLASDIARARMQAISRNMWVKLETTSSTAYHFQISPDNASFTEIAGSAVAFPTGMSAAIEGGSLVFDRSGLANANTDISVSNSAGTKKINVNRIGRVKVKVS